MFFQLRLVVASGGALSKLMRVYYQLWRCWHCVQTECCTSLDLLAAPSPPAVHSNCKHKLVLALVQPKIFILIKLKETIIVTAWYWLFCDPRTFLIPGRLDWIRWWWDMISSRHQSQTAGLGGRPDLSWAFLVILEIYQGSRWRCARRVKYSLKVSCGAAPVRIRPHGSFFEET